MGNAHWSRRTALGAAGLTALGGTGVLLYRASPRLWHLLTEGIRRPVAPSPHRPDPRRWPDTGLYAAWLGHASVLLKMDGFTILTDPVFSTWAGLNLGPFTLGMKRLVAPALAIPDLPPVDLILLSHAHMDHLDVPSLRRLENPRTTVLTASRTSDLFRPERFRETRELNWEQRTRIGPLQIRTFRVNHWGARMRSDRYRGYNGYVLEAGRYRVLFAGDTAETEVFKSIRGARAFDLAIMPIGAYNPWIHYHCTPEQAWRMGNDAHAEFFLPIHHQTFRLSDEPVLEPIERFYGAAGRDADRVAVSEIGQEFRI
jgi:L-ascorbate metabolism protein UlaG (beta-lactamase superfamily)